MVVRALPYSEAPFRPIIGLALRGNVRSLAHRGIDSLPQAALTLSRVEGIVVRTRASVCFLRFVRNGPREGAGQILSSESGIFPIRECRRFLGMLTWSRRVGLAVTRRRMSIL